MEVRHVVGKLSVRVCTREIVGNVVPTINLEELNFTEIHRIAQDSRPATDPYGLFNRSRVIAWPRKP